MKYISKQNVTARPMARYDFCVFRGEKLPDGKDPTERGFLITNHAMSSDIEGFDGYLQWLPERQFAEAFKPAGTAKARVHFELSELSDNLYKLGMFLLTDTFLSLSEENQELLKKQAEVMAEYESILTARLALLSED